MLYLDSLNDCNNGLNDCSNGLNDNLWNKLLSSITGGVSNTVNQTGSNIDKFITDVNDLMRYAKPIGIIAGTILGVKWMQEIILNDRQLRKKK